MKKEVQAITDEQAHRHFRLVGRITKLFEGKELSRRALELMHNPLMHDWLLDGYKRKYLWNKLKKKPTYKTRTRRRKGIFADSYPHLFLTKPFKYAAWCYGKA
jgi:hypothetical protein